MDAFLGLLNSYSIIIPIATVMIIAFTKAIIKIFNMGIMFKSNTVTRDELKEFEDSIRQDMRGYAVQIQKLVTTSSLTVINDRLKEVDEVKKSATEMKIMKTELQAEMKNAIEKCNDAAALQGEVRNLSTRVQRLEYNQQQSNITSGNDRRSL